MSEGAIVIDRKWRRRGKAVVRFAALGGLFAGGALLVGELLGPSVARHIGESGGEGFAHGVASVQDALGRYTTLGTKVSGDRGRGRRFL